MVRGRRAGLLHKTLNELAEDWLDKRFDARRRIGTAGTTVMEQADHLAASAVFGAAYGRCATCGPGALMPFSKPSRDIAPIPSRSHTAEAALTGESLPVVKNIAAVPGGTRRSKQHDLQRHLGDLWPRARGRHGDGDGHPDGADRRMLKEAPDPEFDGCGERTLLASAPSPPVTYRADVSANGRALARLNTLGRKRV
jgi:hypothetical protein